MRLAVLTNILAPYRVPLFEEIARRCDLEVILLADRHANRDWAPSAVGFSTRTLPGLRIERADTVDPTHLNFGAWSALRKFRPDVVLGGGFTPAHLAAFAYCRAHRRRYVCWGELILRHPSEALALRRWVRHGVVRASDGWIASSSETRDAFVHYGAKSARVLVSLMPVRNAIFHRHAMDAHRTGLVHSLRERHGTPLILGVGRLAAEKGWTQLLQALQVVRRDVPEAALVIAGDGPERADLEAQVKSLGLERVYLIGSRNLAELCALYAAADVFVFPTLSDPYGAVLAEAIACGTLAVASVHAAATRDLVVHEDTGYAADPRDTNAFAAAISQALRVPQSVRAAMVARAAARLPADDSVAGADDIVSYARAVVQRRGGSLPIHAKPDP
jgi:glycosyltransferase involved in cell wall biosynthesis